MTPDVARRARDVLVERALERRAGLVGLEGEGRARCSRSTVVGPGQDRRLGRCGDAPVADGRRQVGVAGGVGRPHAQLVVADGEAGVAGGRGARSRRRRRRASTGSVEPASLLENVKVASVRAGLGRRARVDRGLRRRRVGRRLDGPDEAGGRRVDVAGRVGRADDERMLADGEAGVRPRRRARRRTRTPSSEHSNVGGLGGTRTRRSRWSCCASCGGGPESTVVSGGVTSTTVPAVGGRRRVDVAGVVDRADLERVRARGQTGVGLRALALAPARRRPGCRGGTRR